MLEPIVTSEVTMKSSCGRWALECVSVFLVAASDAIEQQEATNLLEGAYNSACSFELKSDFTKTLFEIGQFDKVCLFC